MASNNRHGAHSHVLSLPALTASSATDSGVQWSFLAWQAGSTLIGGDAAASIDLTPYQLDAASFVTYAVLTGQATNFAEVTLSHFDPTGVLIDRIEVEFSAVGVVTVAQAPCNLAVASGAVVPGAGTGVLGNPTGVVLPWVLNNGDGIVFERITEGTGLATPAMSCTFRVSEVGT